MSRPLLTGAGWLVVSALLTQALELVEKLVLSLVEMTGMSPRILEGFDFCEGF